MNEFKVMVYQINNPTGTSFFRVSIRFYNRHIGFNVRRLRMKKTVTIRNVESDDWDEILKICKATHIPMAEFINIVAGCMPLIDKKEVDEFMTLHRAEKRKYIKYFIRGK